MHSTKLHKKELEGDLKTMINQVIQCSLDASTADALGSTKPNLFSTSYLVVVTPFGQTAAAQTALSSAYIDTDGVAEAYISRYRSGYVWTSLPGQDVNVIDSISNCVAVEFTLTVIPLTGTYVVQASSVGTVFTGTSSSFQPQAMANDVSLGALKRHRTWMVYMKRTGRVTHISHVGVVGASAAAPELIAEIERHSLEDACRL